MGELATDAARSALLTAVQLTSGSAALAGDVGVTATGLAVQATSSAKKTHANERQRELLKGLDIGRIVPARLFAEIC